MSIRARGNTYLVDVKLGARRVRRHARTRAEARELEARIRTELKESPARGLEEALLAYMQIEAPGLRDSKGLRTNAKAIRPFIAGQTLDDAPAVATAMKRAWVPTLKPATINRRLALLRRLCNLAHDWGWTDKAIGRRIKLLPENNERHVYLSREQVEALAGRMPHAGDMVRFAAYTGLRLGELTSLTQANVAGQAIVLYQTKTTKPRMVPVPSRIKHLLERLPWPVTETIRRQEWDAARKACGLPHVKWHDLRHTYASFLASAGRSDREIGELLGHSSAQMTRRYAHLRGDQMLPIVIDL